VSPRTLCAEIRLTAPAPHRGRTGTVYLEPGKTVEFEANQDAVLADTDYRVEIVVFGDSALADTLQQSSGNLRFDARTVRDIEKRVEREDREDKRAEETRTREAARLAEAARLPKTYDRLMFFDDALSVFSGNAFTPRGTLVVNADSAIFRSKRRVLAIAGAQILGASVRMEGGHSCVVVEYDEGGTTRAFRLMAGLMGGFTKLDEMAASLNACRTQPKSGD